jgi:hypothetical protein
MTSKESDLKNSEGREVRKVIKEASYINYAFIVLQLISGIIIFLFDSAYLASFNLIAAVILFYFNNEFLKYRNSGRQGLIVFYLVALGNGFEKF